MTDPEIKHLLGRALGEEPPLGIDRDEVFRRGRKRLRTRRTFEAGGVVAAVVVAAVGAALLTGVVGEPEKKLPPAASTTAERPAPPGPTLPLTTPPPTSATTGQAPPSSQDAYPGSVKHANQLTDTLFEARVFHEELNAVPGRDALGFVVDDGNYVFEADVENGKAGGAIFVSVSLTPPDAVVGCGSIPEPKTDCELTVVDGQAVSVAMWQDKQTGEQRYLASTVKPDGSTVSVIATNLSERQRDSGQRPSPTSTPVLDRHAVATVAALPGLTYH